MPREISSIKPDIKELERKKLVGGRVTVSKTPEEIKFYYDLSEYKTFEEEGFQPPANNERFDIKQREFLKRVDLGYSKIKVRILQMIRQKRLDPTSERKERKEYLTFTCEWTGYDFFGAELKMGTIHTEGMYKKQTMKLVQKIDKETGRMESWYEMGIPEMAYSIPFTKENVDKYLLNPHPFGPDSENITDPEQVVYYGKFEHMDTGTMAHRDDTYNYEQFVNPNWREFCDLTNRPGGPRGLLKNYRIVQELSQDHIG
jgi:hypothetical protein